MSHVALQRVIVRMLYDADFAARVAAAPVEVLADADVTAEEAAWLAQPDPRAFAADPLRRLRTLHGLLEEYPASGALAIRIHRGSEPLLAFFGSSSFHQCIQQGALLASAFGDWLGDAAPDSRTGRRLRAVALIERGVAGLRRQPDVPPTAELGLSPHVALVETLSGALEAYQAVIAKLASAPLARALDPTYNVAPVPPLTGRRVHLLLERHPDGQVTIEPLNDALAGLLRAARRPITRVALEDEAIRLGAAPTEAPEVVEGLLTDGLLVTPAPT